MVKTNTPTFPSRSHGSERTDIFLNKGDHLWTRNFEQCSEYRKMMSLD